MDNIDFDQDEIVNDLDEYRYHTVDSEWFDEHSTWRSIFFNYENQDLGGLN